MSIYDEAVEVARRTMVLFFVVDASGSMSGEKIGTLNDAIERVIPELTKLSQENADAKIKIAVLQFSSGATWLTAQPMELEGYRWSYIQAGGVTDLGAACIELNNKLSINAFMNEVGGSYAPAIFLLSDGQPTDDWKNPLEKLWENNWFKAGIKVALAIGDDVNDEAKNALKEFTGNIESVIEAHDMQTLRKMIRFVSVTASKIGSQSSAVGGAGVDEVQSKQEEMTKQLQNIDMADTDDGW
jgi:uncharacterized protein YegL